MALTINFNLASRTGQTQLSKAHQKQAEAMKRLSSGLRINSAKDDAAGLAIGDRIEIQISSQQQVKRNILDGLSYAQTGDAALSEIQALLQRGHELAVQAVNETLSNSDRQSLEAEFAQLKKQITDIANNTEIFGKHPLQKEEGPPTIRDLFGTSGATLPGIISGKVPMSYIPAGSTNVEFKVNAIGADDDIQIFTRDGKHLVGTDLSDFVWNSNGITNSADVENAIFTKSNGYESGASYDASQLNSGGAIYQNPPAHTSSYNGMNLTYTGDADRTDPADGNNDGSVTSPIEIFRVDQATEDLLVSVVGTGVFIPAASWDYMPEGASLDPMEILVETTFKGDRSYIVIDKTPADAASLGVAGSSIASADTASDALDTLKVAMQKVSAYRGEYGAKMNALESSYALQSNSEIANNAALSRIVDADMAQETTALTRAVIQQNAATSVLSQAQRQPQLILSLLT